MRTRLTLACSALAAASLLGCFTSESTRDVTGASGANGTAGHDGDGSGGSEDGSGGRSSSGGSAQGGTGGSVEVIVECTPDGDECDANAICVEADGSFHCECDSGYEGDGSWCDDIDECSQDEDNCDANAICINEPGGFSCECNPGYEGSGTSCDDIDECADESDDCDENATCTNEPGGFSCECNPGYDGDGTTCEDIDECAASPFTFSKTNYGDPTEEQDCITPDVCITRGDDHPIYNAAVETQPTTTGCSFEGPAGTQWAAQPCETALPGDFATFLTHFCSPAYNLVGTDACLYLPAYEYYFDIVFTSWTQSAEGGGFTYMRTPYGDAGAIACGVPGSSCQNTDGGFECTCPDGYETDPDSGVCVDIDECADELDDCDDNATCVNEPGGFACECNPGYAGDGTACSDIDECAGAPVTFTKEDHADPAEVQDCIVPGVCLTRDEQYPLYNAAIETGADPQDRESTKPTGTLWARGTCTSLQGSPYFGPFLGPEFANGNPANSLVGVDGCLYLPDYDLYFDIVFESWTSSSSGGGFSYTRTPWDDPAGAACGLGGVTCENTTGSFLCACPEGFVNDPDTGQCTDVDECSEETDDCSADATCSNTIGSYSCACNFGFAGDGVTCTDLQECAGEVVDFSKGNFADPDLVRDCIAPDVCLTRGDEFSIYNSAVDAAADPYYDPASIQPSGTLWSLAPCATAPADSFGPFLSQAFAYGYPYGVVDQPGCLQLPRYGAYFDITFTSWTQDGSPGGGGFSYTRMPYGDIGAVLCGAPGAECVPADTLTCSCPGGYEAASDGTCTDIDECQQASVCDLSATCVNFEGGVRCVCPNPIDFVKTDAGTEQDCITPSVCLTRGDQYPIFNAVLDAAPDSSDRNATIPTGTEWAVGTCDTVAAADFGPFLSSSYAWSSAVSGPAYLPGVASCLHILAEDIYIDLIFTSWTRGTNGGGTGGGGFSYSRTQVIGSGEACL